MKKQIAILASIATVAAVGVISVSADVAQPEVGLQPTAEAVAVSNDGTIVSSDVYFVEEAEDGSLIVTDQDGNIIEDENVEFGKTEVGTVVEPFGMPGEVVESYDYAYSIEEAEDGSLIVTDQDGNIVENEGVVIGKTE